MKRHKILFVTGNPGKAKELEDQLRGRYEVDHEGLDLKEIQSLDGETVGKHKLSQAVELIGNETPYDFLLVDDTSLEIQALNGLPGTLTKWFLEKLGPEGIYRIASDSPAYAICLICVFDKKETRTLHFFGEIQGSIVAPRGEFGFGWDSIFKPDASRKTYAEMLTREKQTKSHRTAAINKLMQFGLGLS